MNLANYISHIKKIYYNHRRNIQISAVLVLLIIGVYLVLTKTNIFADVTSTCVSGAGDTLISNNRVDLAINDRGTVTCFRRHDNKVILMNADSLNEYKISSLYLQNSNYDYSTPLEEIPATSFSKISTDLYQIKYQDIATAKIKIEPKNDYIHFKVENYTADANKMPENKSLAIVQLFNIRDVVFRAQYDKTANDSKNPNIFLQALPLNPETICPDIAGGDGYNCYAIPQMKVGKNPEIQGAEADLVTTTKNNFYPVILSIIDGSRSSSNPLPKPMVGNNYFRQKSWPGGEPYIKGDFDSNCSSADSVCYQDAMTVAKAGGFKEILFTDALKQGSYNIPTRFDGSLDSFKKVASNLRENGLNMGIHIFFGKVTVNDAIFKNNKNKLGSVIEKMHVGKITTTLTASATTINFSATTDEFRAFESAKKENKDPAGGDSDFYFLIDNELIGKNCSPTLTSGKYVMTCPRGQLTTAASTHSLNADIYVAFYANGAFYISNEKINESANSFAAAAKKLGANLIYADGYARMKNPEISFAKSNNPNINGSSTQSNYIISRGLVPYLKAIEAIEPLPAFDSGLSPQSYLWYYANRLPTWDPAVFKTKEFTKFWKLRSVINLSPSQYNISPHEFGWFEITSTNLSATTNKQLDIDVPSEDDIHYIMSKVVAWQRSISLSLNKAFFDVDSKQRKTLLTLFKRYHSLINDITARKISLPSSISTALQGSADDSGSIDYGREAELNTDDKGRYQFIEKKVFTKDITPGDNTLTVDNPFGEQKLRVEIRPRPDFENYDNGTGHYAMNFSHATVTKTGKAATDPKISCTLNSQGLLTVTNNSANATTCDVDFSDTYNLLNHRGVGVDFQASSTSKSGTGGITLELAETYRGYPVRDYRTEVDLNNTSIKRFISGDPDSYLPFNNQNNVWRNRTFNYNQDGIKARISIDVPKQTNITWKFNSFKILKEKPTSTIVDPSITVGRKTITLDTGDHPLDYKDDTPYLLTYDGYSKKALYYKSNYGLFETKENQDSQVMVNKGKNDITFKFGASSTTSRAEVKVIVYDDEDNDGIPTDGDFDGKRKTLCNPSSNPPVMNFCDDNNPTVANHNQKTVKPSSTPSPTPSPTPTLGPTPTAGPTPTRTIMPTPTPTPTTPPKTKKPSYCKNWPWKHFPICKK